jgi:hypothetical protein
VTQTVVLRTQKQRDLAKHLIDRAPADYVVTIREQTRTGEQNDMLWSLLSDISRAKPEGRKWTPETWKSAFMHSLGHQVQFCEGLDNSGPFPLGFRSSKLNKQQFSDLLETVLEYGARHGVVFSEPTARAA